MSSETDFKLKLGRIRSAGGKSGRKYLHQVLRAAALAGSPSRRSASRFHGNRIGRGAGVGRVLAARDHYAAFRQRRVVIKSRIVRIKGKSAKAAQVHLRYIQRDGVTREGSPGTLYDANQDRADGKTFLERGEGDRHQFRFIVSPEEGGEYEDLKPLTRRLMARMEEDLGTTLDWVAVDHFNTGHPHSHIVLRGRDDQDKDLIIARDYISQGMRERASEIVSFDLGPRTDLEIDQRLRHEVEQERFTSLDRRLLHEVDSARVIQPSFGTTSLLQETLRAGRLQKLKRLGLAEETAPGHWRLSDNLETTLREMGLRGDIIKTMHRDLAEKGLARPPADYAVYDPHSPEAHRIVGRVVSRGLSDEINDRHYLIIDGTDGFSHYVEIGKAEGTEPTPEGSIVAVDPKRAEPRTVDRTVAEIAAANDGRYDIERHLRYDPSATAVYAETHVRRLEAMRRLTGTVERTPDGTWVIAPDHLERATAFERSQAQISPVTVTTLSRITLDRQGRADAATWLDHELVAPSPTPLRESGFGEETRKALSRRRFWLMERELARQQGDGFTFTPNLIAVLRQRELVRAGGQLSTELGLSYVEKPGGRVEGTYRRSIELVSGRFAIIESRSKEFTLVPWRPVLERNLGRHVSGIVRGEKISWTIGRQRSGPSI